MNVRYRKYSNDVPQYLGNRPRDLAISIIKNGVFSIKSFENNESKRYMVTFGDDVNMPKCTCLDWESSCYPCEHFFVVFCQFHAWQWDALSLMYISSPFLILDNLNMNNFFDDISHVEDQKISEGINNTNYQNESSTDKSHYLTENAKFATEIASPKRSRLTIILSLIQKIENITFEI